MIDLLIPFLFGLMVGAAGGVMIAALLVASRESEKIGAKTGQRIVHCKDCEYSEHWYGDKGRCLLYEIDVFEDGFCSYLKNEEETNE